MSEPTEPMHPLLKTILCTLGKTFVAGAITNASRDEAVEIFFKALPSCVESSFLNTYKTCSENYPRYANWSSQQVVPDEAAI